MSLYEDWMKKAFSQEGRSIEAVWEEYLPKEQKIYEYILGEKVTKLEGTIAELAARFDMTAEMIVAFIDGLNASLEEPFDMETLAEDTKVCINIDFEKLYKLMVEYKAEHLSNLPQWDGIYDAETRKHFALEQKKSKTIVKGEKIVVTIPAPAFRKKYKKCCGETRKARDRLWQRLTCAKRHPQKSFRRAAKILQEGGLGGFSYRNRLRSGRKWLGQRSL